MNYAEDDIVSFLINIDGIQIFQAKEKLAKKEDDWLIKQSIMSPDELRTHILDRSYEFLEDWLGRLESSQKKQLAIWVKPDLNWVAIRLRNREKFQNDLINLLKSKELLKENIRMIKFSRITGSCNLPSSSTGINGKVFINALANIPGPCLTLLLPNLE